MNNPFVTLNIGEVIMSKSRPFDGSGPTIQDVLDKIEKKMSNPRIMNFQKSALSFFQVTTSWRGDRTPSYLLLHTYEGLHHLAKAFTIDKPPRMAELNPTLKKFHDLELSGLIMVEDGMADLLIPLLDSDNTFLISNHPEGVEPNDSYRLWEHKIDEDNSLYWLDQGDHCSSMISNSFENGEFCAKFISDKLWSPHDKFIELIYDAETDYLELSSKKKLLWNYEGDQGKNLIQRWQKFYDKKVRRSVIIHGQPGTGKSTLAQQAARELKGRAMIVSVQTLVKLSIYGVLEAIETLAPDIFIIDDLDRMGESDLDLFLNFFEESENMTPLIIATTNHLEHLPDALKRPGRFDEIWEIKPPKGDVRVRVIKYLAHMEDFELDEETATKIMTISEERNMPGAHVRELIRRVKVLGPAELDFKDADLTFTESWSSEEEPFRYESTSYHNNYAGES